MNHWAAAYPSLSETAMRKIVEKWTPATLCLFTSLKGLDQLIRLGIAPKEDPWRKWTRAFCTGELCKFLVPLFGLNPHASFSSNEHGPGHSEFLRRHVVNRVGLFLRTNRGLLSKRLDWGRSGVRIVPHSSVDIVLAEFDENDRLVSIQPNFEHPACPVNDAAKLNRHVVAAYNATRDLDDERRPFALRRMLRAELGRGKESCEELAYMDRVLSSVFVHFATAKRESRFEIPDFAKRKHPGAGIFNIVCRLSPGHNDIDLWFQTNHVLADGEPVVELLDRLKCAWGITGQVQAPNPDRVWTTVPTSRPGREVVRAYRFLEFERLLSSRRDLNRRHAHQVGRITLASMIVWGVAQHPALREIKIMTVVDVPQRLERDEERTIGFVGIRPARFLNEQDREESFLRFQADFNQQLHAARRRENVVYQAMNAQALLPVRMYRWTNALIPHAVDDLSGTVVLSIMKNTDFTIAPIDDRIKAVITIGNVLMPSEDGVKVGVVSISSVKGKEEMFRRAVFEAICRWQV
jgi:hypothetical protein